MARRRSTPRSRPPRGDPAGWPVAPPGAVAARSRRAPRRCRRWRSTSGWPGSDRFGSTVTPAAYQLGAQQPRERRRCDTCCPHHQAGCKREPSRSTTARALDVVDADAQPHADSPARRALRPRSSDERGSNAASSRGPASTTVMASCAEVELGVVLGEHLVEQFAQAPGCLHAGGPTSHHHDGQFWAGLAALHRPAGALETEDQLVAEAHRVVDVFQRATRARRRRARRTSATRCPQRRRGGRTRA